MKIRVYYEDTDAGGIVYHTNYIKYCERARSEACFSRGIMPGDGSINGFVVRDIKASFLSTSTLGDILTVHTITLQVKHSSFVLLQEIFKENLKVFTMEVVMVYIEHEKPTRIPENFRNIFTES